MTLSVVFYPLRAFQYQSPTPPRIRCLTTRSWGSHTVPPCLTSHVDGALSALCLQNNLQPVSGLLSVPAGTAPVRGTVLLVRPHDRPPHWSSASSPHPRGTPQSTLLTAARGICVQLFYYNKIKYMVYKIYILTLFKCMVQWH